MQEHKAIILVVDDEPTNINVVSQILAKEYNIKAANSGKKAFIALEKFNIDLLLLDIQMPQENGFDIAQTIRKNRAYNHIPIIFLTSQSDEASIIQGFDCGGNDYITKPFNPKELQARVHTHLKVHQLQKFLEMMLNLQPSITVLTDGFQGKFINKTGLDFFGFENSEHFFETHPCICNTFLENSDYFYASGISEDMHWISEVKKLPAQKRVVKMCSAEGEARLFHISLKSLPQELMHIVEFTDITETTQEKKRLQESAEHDALTGVYNRNYFDDNITALLQNKHTSKQTKAIAFIDIDYFKKVNDTYGHDAGDDVLKQFVSVIEKTLRSDDLLVRWGGEEFIVLLQIVSENDLLPILQKIRLAIQDHHFVQPEKLTCSIGAAFVISNEEITDAIKRADEALYKAKANGRNKVVIDTRESHA